MTPAMTTAFQKLADAVDKLKASTEHTTTPAAQATKAAAARAEIDTIAASIVSLVSAETWIL